MVSARLPAAAGVFAGLAAFHAAGTPYLHVWLNLAAGQAAPAYAAASWLGFLLVPVAPLVAAFATGDDADSPRALIAPALGAALVGALAGVAVAALVRPPSVHPAGGLAVGVLSALAVVFRVATVTAVATLAGVALARG